LIWCSVVDGLNVRVGYEAQDVDVRLPDEFWDRQFGILIGADGAEVCNSVFGLE